MGKKPPPAVVFATPNLSHSVAREFHHSALQTDWLLAEKGWNRIYIDHPGDQFIAKARNILVQEFLDKHPMAGSFFFLDDDLGWPAEKIISFLESPVDILVGAYPKRSEEKDWPIVIAGEEGKLVEQDGLIRVVRGPTGFMRIKRHVLEAMREHAPPFMHELKGEIISTPGFFAAGVAPDGYFWTEDYIFCQNAVACGFEIWLDPDIKFTHRGTRAWEGNIIDDIPTFRERAAEMEEARLKSIPVETTGELIEGNFKRVEAAE